MPGKRRRTRAPPPEPEPETPEDALAPPLPAWVREAGAYYFTPMTAAAHAAAVTADFFGAHIPSNQARMLPVRCFGCAKVLGGLSGSYDALWLEYKKAFWAKPALRAHAARLATLTTLDRLGIKRMCCKDILMNWVDVTEFMMHQQPKLRNTS